MSRSDEKPNSVRPFFANPAFYVLLAALGIAAIPAVIVVVYLGYVIYPPDVCT